MAGGHVCSLDPNCHDHSLLKTIDNTAKWWSGLLTSEVLLHIFQKLRIHYSKIWLKSFLNATVSLGRVGTNKQKQKTVTLGEEITKGEATAHFGRLKRKLNFISLKIQFPQRRWTAALKRNVVWMLLFAHLFKMRLHIASTGAQDLHVFKENRPNKRCGRLSKKSLKADSSAVFFF